MRSQPLFQASISLLQSSRSSVTCKSIAPYPAARILHHFQNDHFAKPANRLMQESVESDTHRVQFSPQCVPRALREYFATDRPLRLLLGGGEQHPFADVPVVRFHQEKGSEIGTQTMPSI